MMFEHVKTRSSRETKLFNNLSFEVTTLNKISFSEVVKCILEHQRKQDRQ